MQPDTLAPVIDRAISGDRTAARAIYDAHVNAVYRLACRIVGPDLAAECTQDTFVRAFQRLSSFRHQAALGTWLHSITVSIALNRLRSERRAQRNVNLDDAAHISTGTPDRDPVLADKISMAIDTLPAELRMVVVLRLIEGYSHAEIAQIAGIAEGTSKARLSRARSLLREALAAFAPGSSMHSGPVTMTYVMSS